MKKEQTRSMAEAVEFEAVGFEAVESEAGHKNRCVLIDLGEWCSGNCSPYPKKCKTKIF
jgi:hypothetical protein